MGLPMVHCVRNGVAAVARETNGMDKWEYKVLFHLAEEELNKWGEEGYEIDTVIPPPPPAPGTWTSQQHKAGETTVILKRRKP
jgi:hypothetical protein